MLARRRALSAAAVAIVLASAGLHALWNGLMAEARDTHAVTAVALVAAAVVFAPVAALTWDVDAAAAPYIAASAAIELAYFAVLAAAYARADLSFVYPIARGAAPVIVLAVSVAFLGAALAAGEVVGVLAIAAGVLLVRGIGGGAASGAGLALVVAACIAGYTLVDDEGVRHAAALPYFEAVLVLTAVPYAIAVRLARGPEAIREAIGPRALVDRPGDVRRVRAHARRARDRRGGAGRRAARDERGDRDRRGGDRRARARVAGALRGRRDRGRRRRRDRARLAQVERHAPWGAPTRPLQSDALADRGSHQVGRLVRHEGGRARPRHGIAARPLRAPEGREGGAGDELAVLRRERKRRREAEEAYRQAAREDLADQEAYEAGVIEAYLPAELSDEELDRLVQQAVSETGAEGPRDMGKAIKHVMAAAGGRADGRRVSTKVKEALG